MARQDTKKVVMIFDDDPDTLMLCSIILSAQGYPVHTYKNTTDIISKVEEHAPDVIIMDNWIPEHGGIAATQLLKAHETCKDIPVIFFSANNDIQRLAQEAGADLFFAKPFDIVDLEKIVAETIEAKKEIE